MARHTSQSDFQRINLKELQCIARQHKNEVSLAERNNAAITNCLSFVRNLLTLPTASDRAVLMFEAGES